MSELKLIPASYRYGLMGTTIFGMLGAWATNSAMTPEQRKERGRRAVAARTAEGFARGRIKARETRLRNIAKKLAEKPLTE